MFAWYYQPLSHRYNNFRIFVVKYAPTGKKMSFIQPQSKEMCEGQLEML